MSFVQTGGMGLSKMMKRMAVSVKRQIDYNGYVFVGQLQPEISILELASEWGEIQEIQSIPAVQRITPRQKTESSDRIYSGNYGLEGFPLHTDLAHWYLPPRYIMLRCVTPAPLVFTHLVDFLLALADIPRSTTLRAQFLPRRMLHGDKHLLRLIQTVDGKQLHRWDSLFIVPANREAGKVREHLSQSKMGTISNSITFTHPGDTLVIDNWRMLHGRSAVPASSVGRVVERVYLKEMNR